MSSNNNITKKKNIKLSRTASGSPKLSPSKVDTGFHEILKGDFSPSKSERDVSISSPKLKSNLKKPKAKYKREDSNLSSPHAEIEPLQRIIKNSTPVQTSNKSTNPSSLQINDTKITNGKGAVPAKRKRSICVPNHSESFDSTTPHLSLLEDPSENHIVSKKLRSDLEESKTFNFDSYCEEEEDIEESLSNDISRINVSKSEIESIPHCTSICLPEDSTETESSESSESEREVEVHHPKEESVPITKHKKAFSQPDFYTVQGSHLLILKKGEVIPFYGYVKVEVLFGELELFGKTLTPESEEVEVFSPRGSALYYFKNATDSNNDNLILIAKIFKCSILNHGFGYKMIPENGLVLRLKKLKLPKILFLEHNIAQQIFPKVEDNLPDIELNLKTDEWNVLNLPEAWKEIASKCSNDMKLLLTGGKSVGKSTLLRYLVNKVLDNFSEVRVIDLDPGQSEFTVPGTISILTVDKALFGPNYTHLKTPEISILTSINVDYAPETYIKGVKLLMKHNETLKNIPTIINYMGYTTGFGQELVASTILLTKPNLVVQIISKHKSKNFLYDLSIDNVNDNCQLFTTGRAECPYKLIKVASETDDNDGWKLQPREMREMSIFSYFGEMASEDIKTLSNLKNKFAEARLSDLHIVDTEGKEVDASAVNANLVALCSLLEASVFRCYGWGVVRGLDVEQDRIVLITPLNEDVLEKVDYLVVGSMSIPPAFLMNQENVNGIIPYLMKGELTDLAQITRRSYLPHNRSKQV